MEKIKILLGSIGAALALLVGGVDKLILIFIILLCVDYFAGLMVAGYNGELSSKLGTKGIIRKLAKFLLIAVAYTIQQAFDINIGIRETIIGFLIANEALSIIENLATLDIPVINKLRPVLKQVENKLDKQLNKITDFFNDESEDKKNE